MGVSPLIKMVTSKKNFFEPKFFSSDFSKNFFIDFYGHDGYQNTPLDLLIPIKCPKKILSRFRLYFSYEVDLKMAKKGLRVVEIIVKLERF